MQEHNEWGWKIIGQEDNKLEECVRCKIGTDYYFSI